MQNFGEHRERKSSRQWDVIHQRGFRLSPLLLSCTHAPYTYPKGPAPKDLRIVSPILWTQETSVSILPTGLLSRSLQANFFMTTVMRRVWNLLTCGPWRLGKHWGVERTAPFPSGEFRLLTAVAKQAEQEEGTANKQTYIPLLSRTRMPASPTGSAHPTGSHLLSLWNPIEKNFLPNKEKGVMGLAAVCWN